ncbi:probable cation-transporting ATPase 13A4 [Selaginella moellendorffii]|uniref:probable cation-transporting ATPase 13A4 n=1 Tax=Selaginella moellendorffii TaxID=88036 RepID=UPI000D1C2EA3|nr:probable cation-transporting ATPase 13A4 [Selaginella moellendorffii]XP_024527353.1 probable cation-transporting ATPase 13A4 [Selaginella moellendorffii]|eukprot:XP_024527352.1 probable cation-transporting ATPase 13A4 [Selaginella moellendorffii]
MGKYPTGPTSCVDDPSCSVLITSVTQTGPLIVYAFWAFVISCCSAFQLWKFLKLRRNQVQPLVLQRNGKGENFSSSDRKPGEDHVVNVEEEKELRITGYTWSYFGEFCYFLCCLTSLHWILLHSLLLFDAYNKCQVGGVDNLCFYGNYSVFGSYDFNGKIFFVVWWLSAIWFTAWVIFKGRVRFWFRIPCGLESAGVVFIWTRESEQILSTNDLPLVHYVRYFRNFLSTFEELHGHSEIVKILTTKAGQRHFFFQGHRFLIKGETVTDVHFKVGERYSDFLKEAEGLTEGEAEKRLEELGPNEIPFKPESLFYSIFDETFTLFKVYQLISYILQFWSSYLFVASLMMFIVALSAAITIYNRRRGQFMIAKITEYDTQVETLRSGQWINLASRNLVPGDVIKLKSGWVLPCDLLIIKGSCVCDESALTGEPMPVQKYAAPNTDVQYKADGLGSRHTLFSGTTLLQAGQGHDDALAIVTETGMSTSKGELVATILYPQKLIFKYDEELQIVACLLFIYAIVCFGVSIKFQNMNGQQSIWVTKWIYCMFIINQIMSPLLPVALEVGQIHALESLKKRGVFCLNPKRIAIAGKIRVFCFDKTGTLTKEGLDFVGVQSVVTNSFGPVLSLEGGQRIDDIVLHGLATCHAVTKFGKDLVGNQVEVKMFSAVGWNLIESANSPPVVSDGSGSRTFRIVRRNEFDQSRATMSVVVEDNSGNFHIYCKGSFEKIKELSNAQSLPADYEDRARLQALQGCYVLGLSYRYLGRELGFEDMLALPRNELEKDLNFISLVLFRNELKPDSSAAIQSLKAGKVRPVMVTGDNAQCGHYIAKQSGMFSSDCKILLGDITNDNSVVWSSLSSEVTTGISRMTTEELLQSRASSLEDGTLELAVTGKAFNRLQESKRMDDLLLYTRIFARFTPSDKEKVVTMHRNHGLIVGMCGDGGNDCGALRAAHAGIALSAAEASVVSPFTARNKSVQAVVDLLREARGALHTSFACYKFLIIYGLQFSIFKLCCYWFGIIACQMDYIFIDGVAVLSLGYAMSRCNAEKILNKVRPTSSLLGPLNVASVLGLWGSNVVFLVAAICFMASQKDYVRWPAQYSRGASWWTLGDNWESTVLFFTMYFQFITSAFVFSFGSKFRKTVFKNFSLMVSYWSLIAVCSCLLLLPHNKFTEVWHVASEQFNRANPASPVWASYQKNGGQPSPAMSFDFRFKLWWIILASLAINIAWQKVVVEGPLARILAAKYPSKRPKLHI